MRLLSQLGLVISLVGISPLANAHWVGNWLIGGSGGYADREADFDADLQYGTFSRTITNDYNEPPFPINLSTEIIRDYTDKGYIWNIFGGYQAICRKWLMGIELGLEKHSFSKTHGLQFSDNLTIFEAYDFENEILVPLFQQGFFHYTGSINYESDTHGILSGRIGYAIRTYFMAYLRIGVDLSRDTLSASYLVNSFNVSNDVNNDSTTSNFNYTHSFFGTPTIAGEANKRAWIHRFLLGAGFEVPLPNTCGATLRMEYNYHSKGKTIKLTQTTPDIFAIPSGNSGEPLTFNFILSDNHITNILQPYTQSWKASLVWNFF